VVSPTGHFDNVHTSKPSNNAPREHSLASCRGRPLSQLPIAIVATTIELSLGRQHQYMWATAIRYVQHSCGKGATTATLAFVSVTSCLCGHNCGQGVIEAMKLLRLGCHQHTQALLVCVCVCGYWENWKEESQVLLSEWVGLVACCEIGWGWLLHLN